MNKLQTDGGALGGVPPQRYRSLALRRKRFMDSPWRIHPERGCRISRCSYVLTQPICGGPTAPSVRRSMRAYTKKVGVYSRSTYCWERTISLGQIKKRPEFVGAFLMQSNLVIITFMVVPSQLGNIKEETGFLDAHLGPHYK